jgi:AraC-like DNA-binding protein
MDVLSDILGTVHLGGGVHFRCEFAAPWSMGMQATTDAPFHVVVRGNFWLRVPEQKEPIALHSGDLVVLPHGGAHALLDSPDGVVRPLDEVTAGQPLDHYGPITNSGDGQPASILCGYFRFDRDWAHPVLAALPPLIHIRDTALHDLAWLQTSLNFMIHETQAARPGAEAIVNRLVGVLFIQVVRTYIEQCSSPPGMFAAFADKQIGAALALIHERPQDPWTLESIARRVGVSRSAFATRFHKLVRQTPMQYLTVWRMLLARRLLTGSQLSTAAIAERVGYQSEASFSKTFKKIAGAGPGAYRRRASSGPTDAS